MSTSERSKHENNTSLACKKLLSNFQTSRNISNKSPAEFPRLKKILSRTPASSWLDCNGDLYAQMPF